MKIQPWAARRLIADRSSSKYDMATDTDVRARKGVIIARGARAEAFGDTPRFLSVSANTHAVVFDNEMYGQIVTPSVFLTFVENPRLSRHVSYEAKNFFTAAHTPNAIPKPDSDRANASDNRGAKYAVLREAKANAPTSQASGSNLIFRHSLEQTMIVRAPAAQHPILIPYRIKDRN